MGLTVDSLQLMFVPSSRLCDTKTRPNIMNPDRSNVDTAPCLRIRGQLPAPIVNGRGNSFEKWPDFLHAKF